MKKTYGILLSSIVIIFVILFCKLMIMYFGDNDTDYYVEKFKENKNSFDNIVKFCIELRTERNADEVRIFFDYSSGEKQLKMYWDDAQLVNQFSIIDISDEIKKDIENVEKSFSDLCWDGIFITSNQIVFTTEGNQYAIAYSISGYRPSYIRDSDEKNSIKVKSIGDKWYFLST